MSIPYSAYVHDAAVAENSLGRAVAEAVTRSFGRRTGFFASLRSLFAARPAARHDNRAGIAALQRLAAELESTDPSLSAELRLMACRD